MITWIDPNDIFMEYCTDKALIIAEVGQNHQGSIEKALKYIDTFSSAGADVIKFQTRNNKYLFSEEAYSRPYDSEMSFGATYGEHRESLELGVEDLKRIKKACVANNVMFMSTPFDEPSIELLEKLKVDILKIASFDLGNLSLLAKACTLDVPIVISTGGGSIEVIDRSVEFLNSNSADATVLHCVSEYPCEYSRLSLNRISELIKRFPNNKIGLSDHFSGTLSGPVAYMMGARVFEKHVTLNRAWKGTDHSFALEPEGFRKFVRDIRRVPQMLESKPLEEIGNEPVFKKLGKSILTNKSLEAGSTIRLEDLTGRILVKHGIPVRQMHTIIGKTLQRDVAMNHVLSHEDFA